MARSCYVETTRLCDNAYIYTVDTITHRRQQKLLQNTITLKMTTFHTKQAL